MVGIPNSSKLVVGSAHLFNALGKVFEDGKIGWTDLLLLRKAADAVNDLVSVDYGETWTEWKDWDQAEQKALCDLFKEEFDLPQEGLEEIVEQVVCIAFKLGGVFQEGSELIKKLFPSGE